MKHDKEFYETNPFYEQDIKVRKLKLVTTRKPHICSICEREIPAGIPMVCESGVDEYLGFVSNYQCIGCIDKFFDEEGHQ